MGLALVILWAVSLAAPACSATPAQSPTAPPKAAATAAPTEAPAAKPSRAATPEAKPNEGQSAKPVVPADWKADWDKTVAAAKREGKVVVVGLIGEGHRTAAMAFQKAYPDIQLEFTGATTRRYAPKLLAERRGEQYLLDVLMGAATEVYGGLLPEGVFDPLRPALLLPEVLDGSRWHGGFDDGWGDKERKYVYMPLGYVVFSVYVNRDLVPESELNSLDQLLDPKWKGKIVTLDARRGGRGAGSLQSLLIGKGEDFVRNLLAQDLVIMSESMGGSRGQAEALVRGRYPISISIERSELMRFKQAGLGTNIKPLAPDEPGGSGLGAGGGSIMLVNRAPHPNAARVFINWVLSQEGQKAWVQANGFNSRRLDVEGPPDTAPRVGIQYVRPAKEAADPYFWRAMAIAKEILK